jgi:D-arginine dehydrogenase
MYLPAYGNAVIRALTAASRDVFAELMDSLDTPPLLSPRRVLYIADRAIEHCMQSLLGHDAVAPVSLKEAQRLYPALRPDVLVAAAVDETGSDIDVLALHQGYVRGFKARGGTLIKGARVRTIRWRDEQWVIDAGAVSYSAPVVVNAAGAWADEVARAAGLPPVGLAPMRRSVFVSPVSPPRDFLGWPFLMDAAERFYAKPEGDALLGSPADEVPHPPGDPQPDDLAIALALEHLREVTTFPLRSVHTRWAGLRTFAPDRSPVMGEALPGSGFWWLAGQGGYGIQIAPALARLVAQGVRGEQPAEGDERLYAGSSPARLSTNTDQAQPL